MHLVNFNIKGSKSFQLLLFSFRKICLHSRYDFLLINTKPYCFFFHQSIFNNDFAN